MPKLMIECSRTGRFIHTGIQTDTRSFEGLANFQARTFCPHCKRDHLWCKDDVCFDTSQVVAEAIPLRH
jgi:hypothetical protein